MNCSCENCGHDKPKEVKLLVIYVGVAGIRMEDIDGFVHRIAEKISPQTIDSEIIIIPSQSNETKIECINPKYITEIDLINENNKMMSKLNEHLNHQINIIKKDNDK